MTIQKLMAFFLVALFASSIIAAFEGGAYENDDGYVCKTDAECQIEEARKCWVLCQ